METEMFQSGGVEDARTLVQPQKLLRPEFRDKTNFNHKFQSRLETVNRN